MNDATGRPSTTGLFADALSQMALLFETEIRLVRTELGEKISDAVRAVALLLGAAVLGVAALFLLLQAVVYGLIALGLSPWLSALIVGVVVAIAAGVFVMVALKSLSADRLTPRRSLRSISKDASVVKEKVQ